MAPLAFLNHVKLEGWQIIAWFIIQMAAVYLWNKCKSFAATAIQNLASKAWDDLRYLWQYKSYVKDFKKQQGDLSATVESVKEKIEEAKKRNKTRVNPLVENWLKSANKILQQDIKPTKFFGLYTNCFSQVARAKELESLTKEIPTLIAKVKEFPKEVARATGVPGMEFHLQEFMSFESRKKNFEELKKELEDENKYMIGLQGMGGTGKSTMAIEVGKYVENSNPFDRVIFIEVSTPVDEKRIRDDIAKKLELQLEEEKLLTHAEQIWNKIAHTGKVLIILDNVWEKLDLKNMGIQPRFPNTGRCCILLTTRYENVCTQMGCQKKIKLKVLDEKDALELFLFHAMEIGQDCIDDLRKVAENIVNECGRLPVIVVAVAKTLKDWPTEEWQDALIAIKSATEPSRHGILDENAMNFYNSLKLSYTHLKDKQAQDLFLLCSIFPKAMEIPVELLSRIAIGLGLFGEVDKYYTARSQVRVKKNKLINSSLLLRASEEYVKMHDVIREVALEIANEEINVIMDSRANLKENMKYSSWIINGFPNCFDYNKLEVLLVWINANSSLKVPNAFFEGMKSLRVLFLHSKIEFNRTSALSLSKSIQLLKNIRTLSLTNWELGDISMLIKNLHELESLELINCSIIELPNEISDIENLRFLCLMRCSLEKNNPFEVIARCSQLEELYYVSNDDNIPIGAKVPQITTLPQFQLYHIDGSNFSTFDSSKMDTSIKKCFKPGKLQRIFSKEIIKSLAARAEILELEGDDEIGWNNLIPSIVSFEDRAMKDLIKLSLKYWSEMKCLIHTEHPQLKSRVTFFSKLVELQLVEVDVREICYGLYPDGFLKQLEKLELKKCQELESTLFKGKLELGNLKSIDIEDCSMTCLFHPSIAQSLGQLETLKIVECSELMYIISDERLSVEEKVDDKDHNLRSHDSMFPKLKLLNVKGCQELEFILPICFCEDLDLLETVEIFECENLRYMFGQYPGEGGLHQMQKEITLPSLKVMCIEDVPSFVNIYPECYLPQKSITNTSEGSKEKDKSPRRNVSWGPLCYFLPKSKTTNKDEPSISKTALSDHTTLQEKYVGNTAHGIFTPPLYPRNLIEMKIDHIPNLSSLFSISITSSMSLLEKLEVLNCDELKHIVIEEVDGHEHMSANSIFPSLCTIEVRGCEKLESVFPASCSTNLVHLESVSITQASQLKYVFGKSCGDDNSPHQNQNTEIHLPALSKLHLQDVPNIVSMCPKSYYVKASSLNDITLVECPQLPINSFIDLSVEGHKEQEPISRKKLQLIGMHLSTLKHLGLGDLDIETIYDLERLQIESPVNSSLETLRLEDLDRLRNICMGPKNLHMSFQYLFTLIISKCHQLKFILSASISRSLPHLRHLWVSNCEELEGIIEDDDDDDPHHQECCFPNLLLIVVEECKRLKYLFSISTCGSLPQLSFLYIERAPELEQIFGGKQGATQELHIQHAFPELFLIFLKDLPKLHTICFGIDFQTVLCRDVEDCPNISLTSTDFEFLDSYWDWLQESERNKGNMDEFDILEQHANRLREVAEKVIKRDPPTTQQNNGSTNIKKIVEANAEESSESEEATGESDEEIPESEEAIGESDEESPESEADEVKDSEQTNKPAQFAASQIEYPQKTLEPTSQEGSKLDEALKTNQIMNPESSKSSKNEHPQDNLVRIEGKSKRITLDQPALPKTEPDIHPDDTQKNFEASVGETSNKIAISIPSTTTETSSPLIPSVSTPKNLQIATSSIETKSESSPSDQLDVCITESAQDEIKLTQGEICMPYASKQLKDDDLMKLFQIMEEGADMEGACEDDSEVPKALTDLEASLEMGLNEIASSKESKLCLENALNTLCSHCSDDSLKATTHSLQQEIQTILSSFRQAYATIDRVTKLEQNEKLMIGQLSQRKEAAMTLLSEIHKTHNSVVEAQTREVELKEQISKLQAELLQQKEAAMTLLSEIHETDNSMVEAQTREVELNEQISKLQAELYSKENEIKECEVKLLPLEEQKMKTFSDTIGFKKELEAVKKESSHMEEDQIKARYQLENADSKWTSCLANLKKTSLLLRVHLKQRL